MIRLSDLRDKAVRSLDGDKLGRVHEVHCKDGQVVALMCGPGSLIERWTGQSEGRGVPWEAVHRIEADAVVIAETGAKRTRRGSQPAR